MILKKFMVKEIQFRLKLKMKKHFFILITMIRLI